MHEAYQSFFPPDVSYVADHARRSMSEYPHANVYYYGVNYGERRARRCSESDIPNQYVPPSSGGKAPVGYAPNDLSFYANIPVPTSYMCMGSKEDFFGGYDHFAQAGIVHYADHHISPGKKQWTWGNHGDFGYAWDRNLADADARGEFPPYIEIMAGVYTDNQPDFSFLQPGETKSWSQYWYPIQKIGPAQHANLDAAINLSLKKNELQLGIAVTSNQPGAIVTITGKRKELARFECGSFRPQFHFLKKIKLPGKNCRDGFTLVHVCSSKLIHGLISFQPKPRVKAKVPPSATEPPAPAGHCE